MPDQSKAELIEERRSNLPLPDDPPAKSDWNSADARINAEGSEFQGSDQQTGDPTVDANSINEPATKPSGARVEGGADLSNVGRQGKDNLDDLPKDAKAK